MIQRCFCRRILAKTVAVLLTTALAFAVTASLQTGRMEVSAQQIDLEAEGPLLDSPIPNDEFRALAMAQLDAIALMCNMYIVDKGAYPKDLYELQASEYWVANIDNLFTGKPILQIEFTPQDSDFEQQRGGIYPLPSVSQPRNGSQGGGQSSGANGGNGAGGESADAGATGPTFNLVSILPPKLDPSKIGAREPGNVLYYVVGRSALQMIIWMNNEVYAEYFQTSPNEGAIRRFRLVKELNPTDKSVLAVAVLIEDAIPRSYSYWQFNTGQPPLLPADIPGLAWAQRQAQFETLRIHPYNPIIRGPVTLVKEFMTGMIADFGDGAAPPVYCMSGKRLRTLREMTDGKYLMQNQNAVEAREKRFFGATG